MSEPSETDSPEQEDFSVQFSVKLVIVAEVPDMWSKKGRPKQAKDSTNLLDFVPFSEEEKRDPGLEVTRFRLSHVREQRQHCVEQRCVRVDT
jgi:hypothetical protein